MMIWAYATSRGIGRLHICEGMMNATKYTDVLKNKLVPNTRALFGKDS